MLVDKFARGLAHRPGRAFRDLEAILLRGALDPPDELVAGEDRCRGDGDVRFGFGALL